MKIRYYRIASYIYRIFVGDIITVPQLMTQLGWMDSNIFRSEQELVCQGAQPIESPY